MGVLVCNGALVYVLRRRWSAPAPVISILLLAGLSQGATSQVGSDVPGTALARLAFLEGAWTGEVSGTEDGGRARREHRPIIHDRFLLMTHDRDPQGSGTRSNESEEWGIFSFDAEREVIVLREFLVEGLVNTYACTLASAPTTLA